MMSLKEIVFFRAHAEYEGYQWMVGRGGYTQTELDFQKARFFAAYQIIEEAMLEREYEAWVEEQKD